MNILDHKKPVDLPKLLRAFGVLAMIMSGVIFLFQGLAGLNQLTRFVSFTGLTVACAILGVFCAEKLKEPKGARCLLALATAAVSALFAQSGAMIFEWLHPEQAPKVPNFLQFAEVTGLQALVATGLTVIVGGIISYFGLSILDRKNRNLHFGIYMALNMSLLLPFRHSLISLIPFGILALGVYYLKIRTDFFDPLVLTGEKVACFGLMVIPMATLLVRNAFYDLNWLWIGALCATVSLFSWVSENYLSHENLGRVSLPLGLTAIFILSANALDNQPAYLRMTTIIVASHFALRWAQSLNIHSARTYYPWVWITGGLIVGGMGLFGLEYPIAATVFALGLMGIHQGQSIKVTEVQTTGVVLICLASFAFISLALNFTNVFHWLNLAVLAGIVFLAASYMERRRA